MLLKNIILCLFYCSILFSFSMIHFSLIYSHLSYFIYSHVPSFVSFTFSLFQFFALSSEVQIKIKIKYKNEMKRKVLHAIDTSYI